MKRRRSIPLQYALHLKSAEGWLALGQIDEALAEWKKLPSDIRLHPDAAPVRQKLFQFWRTLSCTQV
jgi:hypothetical protein